MDVIIFIMIAAVVLIALQYLANELGLVIAEHRYYKETWESFSGLHVISWREFRKLPEKEKTRYFQMLEEYISSAEQEEGCC